MNHRPPPNPSARSASPSSCSAPVSKADPVMASKAQAIPGRPMAWVNQSRRPAMAPTATPTSGKHQAVRMIGRSSGLVVGIGKRVRNPKASNKSRTHQGWEGAGREVVEPVPCMRANPGFSRQPIGRIGFRLIWQFPRDPDRSQWRIQHGRYPPSWRTCLA